MIKYSDAVSELARELASCGSISDIADTLIQCNDLLVKITNLAPINIPYPKKDFDPQVYKKLIDICKTKNIDAMDATVATDVYHLLKDEAQTAHEYEQTRRAVFDKIVGA